MEVAAADPVRIAGDANPQFAEWLSTAGGSLAITTYQAGKLALVGWNSRQISLLARQFEKPLGLAVDGQKMAVATRDEIVLLANAPLLASSYLENHPGRYDNLFLPRARFSTGELNVHDIAFGATDAPSSASSSTSAKPAGLWIVASRFCCLGTLSTEFSFVPRWKPKFVSAIVPEDRCHLNGLAMDAGRPRFVTVLGETDEPGGWRENKAKGGAIIDVESGEVVLRGLSMPHSPRVYRSQLWVLNSGAGEVWRVDPSTGQQQVVCVLPGYLRGLAFVGEHALVGMCQIREKHIFGGLPVQERFADLRCGVAVVNLITGQEVGRFEFTAGVQELYDVQFLPRIHKPGLLNSSMEAARQAITTPEFAYWLRPSSMIEDLTDSPP